MTLPNEIKDAFFARPLDAHKRSVGTVTVVGGSGHYIHAPVIAGLGARAAGAGLVQLVVPDASRIAAGALLPEATFTKLSPTCVPPKANVMVAGMGLGISDNSRVLISRLLSGSCGRLMCCLKYEQDAYEYLNSFTPHVGTTVKTENGTGVVTDVNLITGNLYVKPLDSDAIPFKTHRDNVKIIPTGKKRPKTDN